MFINQNLGGKNMSNKVKRPMNAYMTPLNLVKSNFV